MITSIFATTWVLAKYAFLIGLAVATVGVLFALFHPVRVDLKVRASIIGQRAEFWFWYFFGFFGLGTVASRGNQFLVLQLGTRQWRLWQSQKKSMPPSKPATGAKPAADRTTTEKPTDTGANIHDGGSGAPAADRQGSDGPAPTPGITPDAAPLTPVAPVEPIVPPAGAPKSTPAAPQPSSAIPSTSEPPEPTDPLSAKPSPATSSQESGPFKSVGAPDTVEPPVLSPETASSPGSVEGELQAPESGPLREARPLAPIVPITFEERETPPRPESGKTEESSTSGGFGAKFSRVRRKIAIALSMIRKVFLKGRAIWRRFSPMGKILVADLWNSFWILGPEARIRYGFGEPFLVGMAQGLAAQVGGMLIPWGVTLDCMPVFDQETILIRVKGGVKFAPWRAIYGVLRLLTEKDLWRGLYDLYKWYKSRKKATA